MIDLVFARPLMKNLRKLVFWITLTGGVISPISLLAQDRADLGVRFLNIAQKAGITAKTIYGSERTNKYLLETTGCGAAFLDYDNDGWQDIFLVNGTRFEGLPAASASQLPTNHLYRNNGNNTFSDVTAKAGLVRSGWGQGVCVGDYDNDGFEDLFISYWGSNVLYHNNGNGTFTDVTQRAGLVENKRRWGSGCAFLDYDRDGHLDLFVANYIDFDPKTVPTPETGTCLYKGLSVACGPIGLPGGVNVLYRNNRNGSFTNVSEKSGITKTNGTYGLGALVADFNNDDWPDIYVANDMAPAALYRNNKDGTFTDIAVEAGSAYNLQGKAQAGMGVSAGDYNKDGWLDIFKTNFAGDTSTLYRNGGQELFEDVTISAGIGVNTRWLGWGTGFFDMDNDGWLDVFLVNGHVYPEVAALKTEAGYHQPKVLYRNLRNGRFEDITEKIGGPLLEPNSSRGCAFGDFDNDGDTDIVINPMNSYPELLRCDLSTNNNWIKIRTIGTKSNRSGIGARITCVIEGDKPQIDEVRSGGSYFSQNDLRIHFGLGKAQKVNRLEVRWPSGQVDTLSNVSANQLIYVKEGTGIIRSEQLSSGKK